MNMFIVYSGFVMMSYAVIANDVIKILGTFLASNILAILIYLLKKDKLKHTYKLIFKDLAKVYQNRVNR